MYTIHGINKKKKKRKLSGINKHKYAKLQKTNDVNNIYCIQFPFSFPVHSVQTEADSNLGPSTAKEFTGINNHD